MRTAEGRGLQQQRAATATYCIDYTRMSMGTAKGRGLQQQQQQHTHISK
jgi:hypothetical protein